ncbi:hypothetical protein FJ250_09285 [bacterium]|nr:hypothetical protein [bacterium]
MKTPRMIRPLAPARFLTPARFVAPALGLATALLLSLPAVPAAAAPAAVQNAAKPAKGVRTAKLTEVWTRGGESDDVFFGAAATVLAGPGGQSLVLDTRLSEVKVLGPDGALVRTLAREGDGPGEVRRPGDMFIAGDGSVCLLQGFPGRVVKVKADGTPAGEAKYGTGQPGAGQFAVLIRGLPHPAGMVLAGITMTFGGSSISDQEYFLSLCGPDGTRRQQLLTKANRVDYADFALDEMGIDFVWQRLTGLPDGRVFVAPERNEYRIQAYGADGKLVREFTRAYQSPPRNATQKEQARRILDAIGANYPTRPKRVTVEATAPAVAGLWATDDGRVWVLTGDEQPGRPKGTWCMLDVFAADGTFERQVALPGRHDPQQDAVFVLRDGRIVVVTGALDSFLSQQAVAGGEEEEGTDLEITCYKLEP